MKKVKLRSKNSSRSKGFTSDEQTQQSYVYLIHVDQHLVSKGLRMDPYFVVNLSFNLIDFCVHRPDF